MGLEHDGLMCKDEDGLESAFFCTLWCNRNDQKILIHSYLQFFFLLSPFKRNISSHISQELALIQHGLEDAAMHRCLEHDIEVVIYYCTV